MRFLQASAVAVGALLLAGCGNIQTVKSFSTTYKEPDGGERARVRVVSDGMVRAVPRSSCVDWRLPDAGVMVASIKGFADQNNRSLGMPDAPLHVVPKEIPTVVAEFYVPANQPLTLVYLSNGHISGGKRYQCSVNKTVTLQAGTDYEASFISTRDKCLSVVTRLTPQAPAKVSDVMVPLTEAPLCRKSDLL
ncbi:hypothetical protein IB233_21055 [Comamonas sp. CMM01]|uniref:hypothetical protein n=1 Tax=Comamonas sp. CMM01 TaxID=2769280 RepID=UPI00177DA35D|nr:hypothetical protein [Comamonas sp. CMM01]MBD9534119.1 hypothetical protein [Comamonas sp. CMM01]